ncbi:MAG: TldD/PmbA family protein [Acidobacteria bacterium]|nr:TldD/PmbA family protein [Acidobacteriota bacterium]
MSSRVAVHTELQETAEEAVRQALRYGADQADAVLLSEKGFQVTTRNGEVESLKQAGSKALGLRVFLDQRTAMVSTSDLALVTVESLVQEALATAGHTSSDAFVSLPEPELYRDLPFTQDWLDIEGLEIPPATTIALAAAAETAARNLDRRIQNSEGATFSDSEIVWCYANSYGYSGRFPSSIFSLSTTPIAVEDGMMQRDYWFSVSHFLNKLNSPQEVGETAARRALRRLGARKVSTCEVPVVFDSLTAASVIGEICNALNGAAIYQKASFLADRLGDLIASPRVTLLDDPTICQGLGSRPFDGEGLLTKPVSLVQEGKLENYLLDCYSARKLGLRPTANAFRSIATPPTPGPSNFYLKAGAAAPQDLIASVKRGLYVTELIGFGVDIVSGDYSRGAVGLWIEGGEAVYPVEEIIIGGNLNTMLQELELVANDLEFRGPIASPTFKISRMTVSGK